MVVLESLNQMEFCQVGCSLCRKRKTDERTNNKKFTFSSKIFLVEFCLLTVTILLQYCKSLFYPYPLIEACINKHFIQNVALPVLLNTSYIFSCKSDRILLLWLIAFLEAVEELAAIRMMLIFKTLVVWKLLSEKTLLFQFSLLFCSLERDCNILKNHVGLQRHLSCCLCLESFILSESFECIISVWSISLFIYWSSVVPILLYDKGKRNASIPFKGNHEITFGKVFAVNLLYFTSTESFWMTLNVSTVSSKRKLCIAIPGQKVLNCRQCLWNLSLKWWSSICSMLVTAPFGDSAIRGSRWGKDAHLGGDSTV